MGALLNYTGELCFLLSDFSIDFGAHDYFTTHLSFKTCLLEGQSAKVKTV